MSRTYKDMPTLVRGAKKLVDIEIFHRCETYWFYKKWAGTPIVETHYVRDERGRRIRELFEETITEYDYLLERTVPRVVQRWQWKITETVIGYRPEGCCVAPLDASYDTLKEVLSGDSVEYTCLPFPTVEHWLYRRSSHANKRERRRKHEPRRTRETSVLRTAGKLWNSGSLDTDDFEEYELGEEFGVTDTPYFPW